ncbi:DUF1168-domain-containing protein [Calocera cornea HHB12733]|uniref:DUF1168-domain-containing protein n=1 Tax=Calocera cornea HHB12733 TaxID=1353952 RepID=A0A165FD12_9BASI|nr:DUF1168-domain-containing protein [Calocera cornea HHB12733]
MATENTNDTPAAPVNRHAPTAYEVQRAQLEKLLKDPAKPVVLPQGPVEKTVRAPREMMKNVQGSSAGAGSGEFHVYKQNRRREYERIKIMEEQSEKEATTREFEQRRLQHQMESEAKTAKNRAKRQKRKERTKGAKHGSAADQAAAQDAGELGSALKKRKFDNRGAHVIFRHPGQEDSEGESDGASGPAIATSTEDPVAIVEDKTIVIVDDS